MTAGQWGVQAVNHFESGPDSGRDARGLRSQLATVGAGGIVIAALWLALYAIAVLHTLTSEHRPDPMPNMVPASVTARP